MRRLSLLFFWCIILVLEIAVQFWFFVSVIFNPVRAKAIVLAYDRLGNIAMGQGNETVSSWAGRKNSWLEPGINKLFEWLGAGKEHCDVSIERGRND